MAKLIIECSPRHNAKRVFFQERAQPLAQFLTRRVV